MTTKRLDALDGWRGISIILVLLGHLFPLGPKAWSMTVAAAGAGMAVFFTLSGFLITGVLLKGGPLRGFLINRVMRIVPLAWLAMALTLGLTHADGARYAQLMLFFANETGQPFGEGTGHFWSLCVEMQFYVAVAVMVAIGGRRALYALPALALLVTLLRIHAHQPIAIDTELRVDEILAGCTLALVWNRHADVFSTPWLRWVPLIGAPLLVASAHPGFPWVNYMRPYIAATMVGSTLGLSADCAMSRLLASRGLGYVARISFAVYVVHGCLTATWLDSGDKLAKYAKRPLFLAVTWALAHLSTVVYEPVFMRAGKRWAARRPARAGLAPSPSPSRF